MYLAGEARIMGCMTDDGRMPGQWLPTWTITTLVVVFSVAGIVFLMSLLVD